MVHPRFPDPRLELDLKVTERNPPRRFVVGTENRIEIRDCGTVALEPDEQVTFVTEAGAEFDLARKDWGFYATPSLNGRLRRFGLRGVLIKNRGTGRYFVVLVERGHEDPFGTYLEIENLMVVAWLDGDDALAELERRMSDG